MNIELGIGIGGSTLFVPTSNDQLVAYAWASALSPSVTTSAVIHKTINAVPANSSASALTPAISNAGNVTVLAVIANTNGNALIPSVAIAGSISINAVIASSNSDSMIPMVSTIRNVSVSGIIANSTATAGMPTVSTSGTAPTIIVQDSFNRADSTTSLGIADTGQTWASSLANGWGIISNRAYRQNSSGDISAVVESGISDGSVSVVFSQIGTAEYGLSLRYTDNANQMIVRYLPSTTTTTIFRRQADAWTSIGSFVTTINANDVLKATLNGSVIKIFVNDVEKVSITEAFNQTATKHGMYGHNTNNFYLDNFKVESL